MSEEAPLLNDEADHPHDVVLEHSQGRSLVKMAGDPGDVRIDSGLRQTGRSHAHEGVFRRSAGRERFSDRGETIVS